MKVLIGDIPVDIQRKNIKNMHLRVKVPDGHVVLSVPAYMSNEAIEAFALANLEWIHKQLARLQQQSLPAKHHYVSGEVLYIWGRGYPLVFVPNPSRNSFVIQSDRVILSMRENSTAEQREAYVREQYRLLLKSRIAELLPRWEGITGLHCASWQIKYMVTRWGTCNILQRRLWFNLQLAQRPVECLEYVILHELLHLLEPSHNAVFKGYLDQYMKDWRAVKSLLNNFQQK